MLIAECLHGMAAVAAIDGDAERSARLWGAGDSLKEVTSVPLSAPEKFIVDQYLEPRASCVSPTTSMRRERRVRR